MAAGKPEIKGWNPLDSSNVAEIQAPQDMQNSADASQDIHPKDKLFSHNGCIIRTDGRVHGRAQCKNHGSLKNFVDIQRHVSTMLRDIRKVHAEGVSYLRAKMEEEKKIGATEEELAEIQAKIDQKTSMPTVGFQIVCKALFKNAREGLSGKHPPVAVNTYAILKEFPSKAAVEKVNQELMKSGGLMCRPYDGARSDEDRIYYPLWHTA